MRENRSCVWTPARVDALKHMWLVDGLSASTIASRLDGGFSRSAIIGKVARLKLPDREQDAKFTTRGAARIARLPPNTRLVIAGGGSVIACPPALPPKRLVGEAAFAALPGTEPRPWTERQAGECNWPVGEGLSCCQPVDAFGLCATHRRIGREPIKGKQADLARSLRRYV